MEDCLQNGPGEDVNIPVDSGLRMRGRLVEVKNFDRNGSFGGVEISTDSRLQRRGRIVIRTGCLAV